LSTWAI